jgi:hypothetical protein
MNPAAPETACIGRELAASTPQEPTARGGAPIFRYGSGSSDVLHALLEHRVTPFRLLVGHSKGALQINNAIQSLPAKRTQGLRVVTLGCPIGENVGRSRAPQSSHPADGPPSPHLNQLVCPFASWRWCRMWSKDAIPSLPQATASPSTMRERERRQACLDDEWEAVGPVLLNAVSSTCWLCLVSSIRRAGSR